MLNSFPRHGTGSLSFYELCKLSFHCGPFGGRPEGVPVIIGDEGNAELYSVCWLRSGVYRMHTVKAANLSCAGMGNYKRDSLKLRVKTMVPVCR